MRILNIVAKKSRLLSIFLVVEALNLIKFTYNLYILNVGQSQHITVRLIVGVLIFHGPRQQHACVSFLPKIVGFGWGPALSWSSRSEFRVYVYRSIVGISLFLPNQFRAQFSCQVFCFQANFCCLAIGNRSISQVLLTCGCSLMRMRISLAQLIHVLRRRLLLLEIQICEI